MGISSSADSPYGTDDLIVTKLIGGAYKHVKLVADNMPALMLLADSAQVLVDAAGTVDSAVAAMDADRASVDDSLITFTAIQGDVTAKAAAVAADTITAGTAKTNAEAAAVAAAASAAAAAADALNVADAIGGDYLSKSGGTVVGNVLVNGVLTTNDNVAFGAGWNGSVKVVTENAVYDKITAMEALYGADNGLATLAGGKIPLAQIPDSVIGAMKFQTTWNATTNTPAIPAAAAGNNGHYYIVATAGATNIDGTSDWEIGDWIVSDGTAWRKLDNSDKVSSVAGLAGVITAAALKAALTLTKADVGLANVANTAPADLPVSTAQAAVNDAVTASLATKAAKLGGQLTASNANLVPTFANDYVDFTALATDVTIGVPTGTPENMKPMIIRIKDNGTSRTITWNAIYQVVGETLPTATVPNKTLIVGAVYNITTTKWNVIFVKKEA